MAKHVLIVGGGFAGLNAAKTLSHSKKINVTLIDRRNHHLFQPLLYQVAMAGLSPAEIAVPIRNILSSSKNTTVLLGEVQRVDLPRNEVTTNFGKLGYDYLILACGARHSYFGNETWERHAPGLKTLEQATEIRRRILTAFEQAEREKDPEKQKDLLTFVVVGGGPTGVELAGALGEISRYTLNRDFRQIDPKRTRVILIEAGKRILPSFSEASSQRVSRDLEAIGIQVWTSSRVTQISEDGVEIGQEFLKAHTVLWAAGVQPSELNAQLGLPLSSSGHVQIESDLTVKGYPNVYILGDQAHFLEDGSPLPGLAPVAIQQGKQAAKNILLDLEGKPRRSFQYFDKGQMATIGRKQAVVESGKLKVYGFSAWLIWIFIHILYLIGFKNRLFVILQWSFAYFNYRRGARLIVEKDWQFHRN